MTASDLNLAMIGNCTWNGLIDSRARVVWACLPRPDGDPVFCALVNANAERSDLGSYAIELEEFSHSEQRYETNSAVVVTTLWDRYGGALEVCDFAPRFSDRGRIYRPTMMVRRLEPISGAPRIRIVLEPASNYGSDVCERTRGSNHIRFVMPDQTLRLTTDAPVSYVWDKVPFVLEQPIHLILGPDDPFPGAIGPAARENLERTRDHWVEWSRTLSIPFEWQDAVIRAAITLKLCTFEETGAVIAAPTTSIPESANSGRNWDYRYCWLRDAYFVVHALNRLGATRTMEQYLAYITNIVAGADGHLQPVYGVGLETALVETRAEHLRGYRGMGPVRVGNQAYEHIQNDVYGSVVLAATQSFFDQRLLNRGDARLFDRLEHVGAQAVKLWDQPDAGLWELRTRADIHTFSAAMCWAACDRLFRIARKLGRSDRERYWRGQAKKIRDVVLERAWNERRGSFVGAFEGEHLDASLLLLHELGFIAPHDPRFLGTLSAIEGALLRGNYLQRYATADDFGAPETAFNICTFWYVDALAAVGRREEAREIFENMLARRNPLGLLSEDLDPTSGELWGNFPQTYSMVGMINSAVRLSSSWDDAF